MPTPDFFGILDATKRLTAPAGLEAAHADGFSWARAGLTFGDSTKLTADDWNRIIANLRLLLLATPGFDPDGRDPADPALMRDVITGFLAAKIAELLPDAVTDQIPALAAALAALTSFVNTVVAAVPTNLNANNLTNGTVPDARLRDGLKVWAPVYAGSLDALTNGGLYYLSGATLPGYGAFSGFVQVFPLNNNFVRQEFHFYNSSAATYTRYCSGGVWGAIQKIQNTQVEQDARYARLSGAAFAGFIGFDTYLYSTSANSVLAATGAGNVYLRPNGLYATANEVFVPASGNMTFAGSAVHTDGNASRGAPDWVLEDQKVQGTSGGTSGAGGWFTRTLNTEVRDPAGLVTLSSNTFVSTVNGWVEWSTPAYNINSSKSRLWNVTDGVLAGDGSNGRPPAATMAYNLGGCAIVAGKTYRLEIYVNTSVADNLGPATSQGVEVYSRIKFWRS